MQQIAKNVYVQTGLRGCNVGCVVTRDGVVLIESPMQPADALKWRDEISRFGPVRYLINTEPHIDHFSGNCYFGGTVVAHEGTRQAILQTSTEQLKRMLGDAVSLGDNFCFRAPEITLSQRLTLHLGGHTFRLVNLPGHTPYQVAVHVPEERVVFTSDNVVYKTMPFMHQAVPDEWVKSLDALAEMDAAVLVPGHGEVCDMTYLPVMKAGVQAWSDAVKDCIARGLDLKATQDEIAKRQGLPFASPGATWGQRMGVAHLYELYSDRG